MAQLVQLKVVLEARYHELVFDGLPAPLFLVISTFMNCIRMVCMCYMTKKKLFVINDIFFVIN